VSDPPSAPEQPLRGDPALERLVRAIVEAAPDRASRTVRGVAYRVDEVTWPVRAAASGRGEFASPHPALTLVRGDAVLADPRENYFDGKVVYVVQDERVGRWWRFRIGSPADRGWDLHLAAADELAAFAEEQEEVRAAFGAQGDEV
jgi:hypothetical protein